MADEDEKQTRKIPTRQDVRDYTKAQEEADRQRERGKDKIASGSNIVSHEAKTKRREAEAQQNVFDATYDASLKRGASQEQASAAADQAVTDSGIGSVTPRLDRYKADMRKLKQSREAEAQAEKTRLLKDSLNKFQSDVSKSMTFGEESALLTPEGRQRALKAAVKSGYSFNEADSMVQGAFKKLQEVGKRENWKGFGSNVDVPVAVPPLLARPEETAATAATATSATSPRDTSPDKSASSSQAARRRGMVDRDIPTKEVPENMGEPTGPPTPSAAVPVSSVLGTLYVDPSGHTYPYKPAPIDPNQYMSGKEIADVTGVPQAWRNLKSAVGSTAEGFMEEYNKAKKESPTTPLRSAAKGAWEALGRATPNKEWWLKGL
jgi:hypothetical protein